MLESHQVGLLSIFLLIIYAFYQLLIGRNDNVKELETINVSIEGPLPGIEYISIGYNLFFGNPQYSQDNIDNGIKNEIFDVSDCSKGHLYPLPNGQGGTTEYLVPNGVNIITTKSCMVSYNYNEISGSNSYQSSLSQSVTVDGETKALGLGKASFSASTEFQTVTKNTESNENIYISSHTECKIYSASLDLPFDVPKFNINFEKKVSEMPLIYDINNQTNLDWFYDFFTNSFGTHYIKKVTMGGIYGTLTQMTSSNYEKFTSSNLEISVAAKYSTIASSAAVKSMTKSDKEEADIFKQHTETQNTFNIGGDLPSNNEPSDWAKSLSNSPMPIQYEFDIIKNLITSQYFPNENKINIQLKQSALTKALQNYCNEIKQRNNDKNIQCDGYGPDPSLPPLPIFNGFYSDNVDNENADNPYTNTYSCTTKDGSDYIPIQYIGGASTPNNKILFNSYGCIRNSQLYNKDLWVNFGGMYTTCLNYDDPISPSYQETCVNNNYPFSAQGSPTQFSCSCPQGFTSYAIGITHPDIPFTRWMLFFKLSSCIWSKIIFMYQR